MIDCRLSASHESYAKIRSASLGFNRAMHQDEACLVPKNRMVMADRGAITFISSPAETASNECRRARSSNKNTSASRNTRLCGTRR
jgi:hypothetical protein